MIFIFQEKHLLFGEITKMQLRNLMEHFNLQQEKLFFEHQVLKIALQMQIFVKDMLLPDSANQQSWNFYKHTKLILQGFGCGMKMVDKQTYKYQQQQLIG
ncbi:unnamed protein product [Paramecium pentaurelia]|uniref:Uncharacterized protein n=1 Tax=Paramecium pentaurelia TaxID=43138 RepID=A0A8S1VKN4_9CILI|nr:unnamed protein product [Paramecium pentaurelia]